MLYHRIIISCLTLLSFIMICSCEKVNPSPLFSNNVLNGRSGKVGFSDRAGINVTAFGPYGNTTTTTDENGEFTFSGLGNGTYRIEYSCDGYGTLINYNIRLFGADTIDIGTSHIFKKFDSFIMPAFLSLYDGNDNIGNRVMVIETTMSTVMNPLPVVIFLDTVPDLTYITAKNRLNAYSSYSALHPEHIDFIFQSSGLPFRQEAKVYFIAYVCNPDESLHPHIDSYHGIPQFSTLLPDNHSDIYSFIMP